MILSRREAIAYLDLDKKTFDNYFRHADEFPSLRRKRGRGRFTFDQDVLSEWMKSYQWRTVELNKNDYALCLDFALAQHFRGYVISDWGTGRQREFGQRITNWVKGQLGELAVKKFFRKEFQLTIELDFNISGYIVPQDISKVKARGKMRAPRIGVGIKSSKSKNAYLILGENEMKIRGRKSDVYIFCRPDIPDDHLLRLTKKQIIKTVKGKPHFSGYKNKMSDFRNIPCEIAGWCYYKELNKVRRIPGQEFNGNRYVIKSGWLKRTGKDWLKLIKKL